MTLPLIVGASGMGSFSAFVTRVHVEICAPLIPITQQLVAAVPSRIRVRYPDSMSQAVSSLITGRVARFDNCIPHRASRGNRTPCLSSF